MTNIFVGNLSYQTTEDELQAAFSAYGTVERVSVVRDRETGQPRGFAFVEMTNSSEATNAINAMNGREINGRALNVNEASRIVAMSFCEPRSWTRVLSS